MSVKSRIPSRPGGHERKGESWPSSGQEPPPTAEERLKRIAALGQRIAGYVQFMGQVASLNGTSAEAKEKAVAEFYEQLVLLERRLGRIHDELHLG